MEQIVTLTKQQFRNALDYGRDITKHTKTLDEYCKEREILVENFFGGIPDDFIGGE